MPVNYSNGKIYKIWSPSHPDEVYIGSTAEPRLSARMSKHRVQYKRYQGGKYGYTTSFKVLAYEDCRIDLIEKYPCDDKCELRSREGHYIKTMNCVNKYIAGRTDKQYREDNKEVIKQRKKEYADKNKDKQVLRDKIRYEATKEKVKQRVKQYRQANKEKIKARRNKKITCECGAVITKACIARHRKTQKHIQAMEAK